MTYPIVTIASQVYQQERGSIDIENRLEERSVAKLSIPDRYHDFTFYRGQPVAIDIDGTLEFGGVIDAPSKDNFSPDGYIVHSFQCADWHYLADKRRAAVSYLNKTCGYMALDLVTVYLAAEGVTVGKIQDGPVIGTAVFSYGTLSECFDALKKNAPGFTWWIDSLKRFYFVARTTYPSPWIVTTADIKKGSAHWSGGNPDYRNTQYIRGGKGLTSLQTETRTGDGSNKAFTVSYPLAQVPTVTVGGVSKTVGIKGIDTGKYFYWSKGDAVVSADTAPSNGASVVIAYYGQFDVLIKSTDDAQVIAQQAIEGAGTGIVEEIADDPTVDSLEAGFTAGAAELAEYSQDSEQLTFATVRDGLRIGQMATISHLPLGINNEQFLISAVRLQILGTIRTYTVTAIRGTLLPSWAKTLGNLIQSKNIDLLMVGTVDTVTILTSQSDNWGWGESVTETVYACPIPSVSLYPSSGLFPC